MIGDGEAHEISEPGRTFALLSTRLQVGHTRRDTPYSGLPGSVKLFDFSGSFPSFSLRKDSAPVARPFSVLVSCANDFK